MGRVRVFYGHQGVVPPTGLRSRSAAPAAPVADEVDEIISDDLTGETVELVGQIIADGEELGSPAVVENLDGSPVKTSEDGLPLLAVIEADEAAALIPDESWTKGDIIAFAEAADIDMTGAKKTQPLALARVLESLEG